MATEIPSSALPPGLTPEAAQALSAFADELTAAAEKGAQVEIDAATAKAMQMLGARAAGPAGLMFRKGTELGCFTGVSAAFSLLNQRGLIRYPQHLWQLTRETSPEERVRNWAIHLEQENAEGRRVLSALVAAFEPNATVAAFTAALGEARDHLGRPAPTRRRPSSADEEAR